MRPYSIFLTAFCLALSRAAIAGPPGTGESQCSAVAQGDKFEFPLSPCSTMTLEGAADMVADCSRLLDRSEQSLPRSGRIWALYGRGRAHVQQLFCGGGDAAFDRAIRDLDAAIRLEPGLRQAYAARALAHEYRGDHMGAVHDFRESYRLGVPPRWLVERLEIIESAP